MSHTVSLRIRIKEPELLIKVAKRKGYKVDRNSKVEFFSGDVKRGLAIHLPGWEYPVVITSGGEVLYDNYNGNWGDKRLLNELISDYVQELVLQTLHHKLSISDATVSQINKLKDGSREIKLLIP